MILVLTLLGCPLSEDTFLVCDYTAATLVDTENVPLGGAALSGAVAFGTDEPPPGFDGLTLDYTFTNLGEDDCAVAIYLSDTEPDPEAIPTIDAVDNLPPESIPGVGTRLTRANLGPVGTSAATTGNWLVPLTTDPAVFITVLACDGGRVDTSLGLQAELCADPDALNDEESAFEVSRVW